MKSFFRKIPRPPLLIAVLLVTAAALLACGPVTQSEPQAQPTAQAAAQDTDPDPTPTPTPTSEPPKYPNLDTFLRDLVAKYEAGELSESEAAAKAPVYYQGSIFVDVDFSTDAEAVARWRKETGLNGLWPYVDEVDRWMEKNQIGVVLRPQPYRPPFIYAYVPVSKLGFLSQREGVTLVQPLQDRDGSFAASQNAASGASGSSGASGPTGASATEGGSGPVHPSWLDAEYDPYAQLGSKLGELVWRYDQGELTAEQVVDEYGSGHGSAVYVDIKLKPDPANTKAIAAWLRSKGVTPQDVDTHEVYTNVIVSDVPVSLLVDLIKQDPGMRLDPGMGFGFPGHTGRPTGLLPHVSPAPRSNNAQTTATSLVTSQGVTAHGAEAWHAATYKGAAIRVGIIDNGFDGFNNLMSTKLPPGYLVKSHCYKVTKDAAGEIDTISPAPTSVIGDCGGDEHGTTVAEAVVDMAPLVLLYISNAAAEVGNKNARTRFRETVDWMIGQNVQIINYSGSWPFLDGMGDGVSRVSNDLMDVIDAAVESGILWVNSAGNTTQRKWRGTLSDTTDHLGARHLNFVTGDDRNYITFVGSNREVTAELRWDDGWANADCDLDLYIYWESASGNIYPVRSSIITQSPFFASVPYERILNFNAAWSSGEYFLKIRQRLPRNPQRCVGVDWAQVYLWQPHTLEHASTGYSIGHPADSKNPGLLSAGAAKHSTTSIIQAYSTRGPTNETTSPDNTTNVERKKPELVGADCGYATYHPTEVTPGTNTPEPGSNCWFWGTSQAAPHLAGMAALVKERFPDYSPEQIAIYLKENAEQRLPPVPDNTDPNNIWGHGFALLPDPADIAGLSPAPSEIVVGQSSSFTLSANAPASTGVRVAVNYPEDTGNLAISSLGVGVCPGPGDYRLTALAGNTVSIKGCTAGTAQVRLYKRGSAQQDMLLQVYTVEVLGPPTNLSLSTVSGHDDRLSLDYTPSGPPHHYQFELYVSNKATGNYSFDNKTPPAIFAGVTRGYQYKARGRNCSDYNYNANTRCSGWSNYSPEIDFSAPSVAISGLVSSLALGGNDGFYAAASNLTVGQSYTVTMSTDDGGIGFNSSCLQTESRGFTPVVSSYNRSFILYACDAPGGTVTAQLRKGGASGNLIDTATFSITVAAASTTPPKTTGSTVRRTLNVRATTTVDVSGQFSGGVDRYAAASSNTTVATASITGSVMTITGVAAGRATITVTASNTTNAIGTATQDYPVTVTAAPAAGGPTIPAGGPSVNAWHDQTVRPGASVSLFGTGSPVDDDDDASYSWTQQSGTTVSLKNSITGPAYTSGLAGNAARFTAPSTAGTLIFRLTVTDHGTGISSWDELVITVS